MRRAYRLDQGMSIVLRNQVEACEKSAESLALEMAIHRASVCRDVEALMSEVVEIFTDIGNYVERWQADVKAGRDTFSAEEGRSFFDLYVRLDRVAGKTASLGKTVESWRHELAGKPQFLNTWRKLRGIVVLNPDRVAQSFAQIDRGEARTLAEFVDELSRGSIG
jgi:hypothetical protein